MRTNKLGSKVLAATPRKKSPSETFRVVWSEEDDKRFYQKYARSSAGVQKEYAATQQAQRKDGERQEAKSLTREVGERRQEV